VYTPHFRSHCALCSYSTKTKVWFSNTYQQNQHEIFCELFRLDTKQYQIENRLGLEPVKTENLPVEKLSLLTSFFVIKTKMSHIFLIEFVKKVLNKDVISIISPEVLFKKIDYVECLLHTLLNYLIFGVIFSKNRFSKTNAIFSPIEHMIPTGRTGPVYNFRARSTLDL